MKKGGTGLHKAIREINLVYKGLRRTMRYPLLSRRRLDGELTLKGLC